ncbi:MAG: hypothetical protein RMM31_07195 [Anaerolineae bacterium]|nr:hypothetical protein [Anaerolineae bacterium]
MKPDLSATYLREEEMYPEVAQWLRSFLSQRAHGAQLYVWDTPRKKLNQLIHRLPKSYRTLLPNHWVSWEVQVDVVGFAISGKQVKIALVECKLKSLTLTHLSQLIGYVSVVKPEWAFLLSPEGAHSGLRHLLIDYKREDVLAYTDLAGKRTRRILVAKWMRQSQGIDWHTAIPQGVDTLRHLPPAKRER